MQCFKSLSGTDALGNTLTAAVMVYVTPDTNRFYLSRSALIQLRVIPKDFPKVGAVMEQGGQHYPKNFFQGISGAFPGSFSVFPGALPFSSLDANW